MRHPREAVIDLGVVSGPEPGIPAGGRPGGSGGMLTDLRRSWGRHRRLLLPAVLAALLLSMATGSGPPAFAEPVTIELPSDFRGDTRILGDRMLLSQRSGDVVAYDLSTGARLWSVARGSATYQLERLGDVLVHTGGAYALDADTGEIRWSRPGMQVAADAGVGLMAIDLGPGFGRLHTPVTHRLEGYDLATGELRWQQVLAGGVRAWLTGEPPLVVTAAADGELALRDPATGELLTSRRLRWLDQLAGPPMIIDDQLLLPGMEDGCEREERRPVGLVEIDPRDRCPVLRGYRLATLRLAWERSLPQQSHAMSCRPMVCVHLDAVATAAVEKHGSAYDTPTVEVVDPATGAPAWATRNLPRSVAGRLVGYDRDGQPQVLDPGTGEPLFDFTGWRATLPDTVDSGKLALTRAGGGEPPPGAPERAPVAVLDLATLAVTEHRWVPGEPVRCSAASGRLACRYGNEIWVWSW